MPEFSNMLLQGTGNAWLFIPTAILLGALHGLEPGHSKTMMAAFIIAVRGTIMQAVLLGLCAAFSHSLVVWGIAAVALYFGNSMIAEQAEPWFMLISGVIVVALATWMLWRTRRDNLAAAAHAKPAPNGGKLVNTGHGYVEVSVFEDGVPPRFRLYFHDETLRPSSHPAGPQAVTLASLRPDGARQQFTLTQQGGYLESAETVDEPHTFILDLTLHHGDHGHQHTVEFSDDEHGHAHHDHTHAHVHQHDHAHHHGGETAEYQDAHQRAHARDIEERFAGRSATTGQIAMFGLTGGLVPCPASVTVLLICLQVKRFALGAVLVASFSAGLALALVSVGVAAAWGAHHAAKRMGGFGALARKAPYLSGALMTLAGLFMAVEGLVRI